MERLDRGIVVVFSGNTHHLVSWRLYGTDPEATAFNLYRRVPGHDIERINVEPITGATNYLVPTEHDDVVVTYGVQRVVHGIEGQTSSFVGPWHRGYWEIPIQTIEGYTAGDASVADLDGDGQYEIVLQQSGRSHDNSHSGLTDDVVLDAYELDGTRLWRINLGRNIRDGEHYTQFMA